ncbi:MAG: hypothetical protein HYU43_08255, partial [Armatimonadetes bacterium]|nr:hypothetical protein [Armatimonadota bacterium]
TVAQCTRDFDNDSADNQFETTNNWNPDGVPGSGGLVMTTGTVDVSGTLDFNGLVDFQGGTMSGGGGLFQFDAGATFSTAGTKTFDTAQVLLPNAQTLTWTDGNILINNGTVFANAGTFDAQGNNQLNTTSGSGTFSNTGTFNKSAGGGLTQTNNNISFVSSGTINVTNGEFNLGGPGTFSGPVNVSMSTTFSITHAFGGTVVDFNSGGPPAVRWRTPTSPRTSRRTS